MSKSKPRLDHLVYKEFELQPEDGSFDAYSVADFIKACGILFMDRDGYGVWGVKAAGGYYLVDATMAHDIRPSLIKSGEQTIPDWATHVIWRST